MRVICVAKARFPPKNFQKRRAFICTVIKKKRGWALIVVVPLCCPQFMSFIHSYTVAYLSSGLLKHDDVCLSTWLVLTTAATPLKAIAFARLMHCAVREGCRLPSLLRVFFLGGGETSLHSLHTRGRVDSFWSSSDQVRPPSSCAWTHISLC